MDLAIVSGLAAARAILKSSNTAETGLIYMKQLEELLLIANERAYQNFHNIFEISRIFTGYPKLVNEAMQFMFTVDGKVPKPMVKGLMEVVKRHASFGQIATDGWKAYRSL